MEEWDWGGGGGEVRVLRGGEGAERMRLAGAGVRGGGYVLLVGLGWRLGCCLLAMIWRDRSRLLGLLAEDCGEGIQAKMLALESNRQNVELGVYYTTFLAKFDLPLDPYSSPPVASTISPDSSCINITVHKANR